jgi:hypothetical protein
MANYSIDNLLGGTQQATSSTYKTQISMTAASGTALRRIKLYDLLLGTNGTPADNYIEWDVSRQTAAASGGTTATALPLDPADAAALTVCYIDPTGEGTVTANSTLFYIGVNQRASYRWVAAPGSELVGPATNLAGLAGRARSGGYTGTVTMTMLFQEQ